MNGPGRRTGPLPGLLAPASYMLARAYRLGWMLDVRRQLAGGAARLSKPVISVGNLTVGGTGKTPVCSHLLESLRAVGATPALALRGYGAGRSGESDEALDYREKHPWLELLIGPDRTAKARALLESDPDAFDMLVLVDGFQHRRLHRDLDIVLVDASRPGLDGDLLPNGWLREPATSIRRADLVIITRADSGTKRAEELVRRFRGSGADAITHHRWSHVDLHREDRVVERIEIGDLRGRSAVIATGLGNPVSFGEQAALAGIEVRGHLAFRDHVRYGPVQIGRLRDSLKPGDCLLTSSKDWVKLARSGLPKGFGFPILVPRVTIDYLDGAGRVTEAVERICGFAPVL